MFIGIDLGTSGVKVVLVDGSQRMVGQANESLTVSTPHPLWSEQDPKDWWAACNAAMATLRDEFPAEMAAVQGIGLSGQMHGATLLDEADNVLRPCILWNDGRSGPQCAELERRVPRSRDITGNLAMPGFTAPKLIWVAEHEPDVFGRVARVLLPKDYLRLLMTGAYISEMSDSAGTLWLDVAQRAWSDEMIEATKLKRSAMPELVEGSEAGGQLRDDVAADWGVPKGTIVAGGAGDNAAGAAGVGTAVPGRAFLSLGTSGVFFVANDIFSPNPERAVHAFCHCFPETWHQMTVHLSSASCLSWITELTQSKSEAALLADVEQRGDDASGVPLFLPYLTGERTPHNNPHAKGVFFGMGNATDRAALARAVLEGVAFAFADGQDALQEAGAKIDMVSVIGGGARSPLWGRILASTLGRELTYHEGGEVGPAFGAARLGRLAATGESPADVCTQPPVQSVIEPDAALTDQLHSRLQTWRDLYRRVEPVFPNI